MTIYELARRFVGVLEEPGVANEPLIQWFLSNVGMGNAAADSVPWCSAFVSSMAMMLRLPRSTSAAARSWLKVGSPIDLANAKEGDVVVLKRGEGAQPGPEILAAPGHVGLLGLVEGDRVLVLGGNQRDRVSAAWFPVSQVLGVRRLAV